MTFALLCPTRARPKECRRMIESARNTGSNDISKRVYLAMSIEDCQTYNTPTNDYGCPPHMPTVFKWNELANMAMEAKDTRLFMLAADDMIFATPLWDKAIVDHYNALENKIHVYHLKDSRDKDGTPHPIVTREYIEAMGYFLPPVFLHWFVDTWTVEIAKHNNCFTHFHDYELVHDKPSDDGNGDSTFWATRDQGWLNSDKYTNEHCQHFLALEKQRLKMRMG